MINSVTYNGINSLTKGVFVSGQGTFNAAELDFVRYEIPGRNGDFFVPMNRYKNIEVVYPAFIPGNFTQYVAGVREWMRSTNTYARITDTYDPDHYRLGLAVGQLEFEPVANNRGANFQLVFDCKPQRFLVSGETEGSVTTGDTLMNPTQWAALPLIKASSITSGATISVSNSLGTFTLTATRAESAETNIDCETQNVFVLLTNANDLFSGEFPKLAPWANTITFSGMSNVKITPRWWEL